MPEHCPGMQCKTRVWCKVICMHPQTVVILAINSFCTCSRHTGDKDSTRLSSRISFKLKQYLATTAGAQASLLCLVLLMTSMVLGDGVLTPAQSVLGAVYGLQVKTSVSQGRTVQSKHRAKCGCHCMWRLSCISHAQTSKTTMLQVLLLGYHAAL